jgi:hypothetical protein
MSKTIHCTNGLKLSENRYGFVKISIGDKEYHTGVSKETLKGMTCKEILNHVIKMDASLIALRSLHNSRTSPVGIGYIGNLESWGDDRGWYAKWNGKKIYSGVRTWDIQKLWDKVTEYAIKISKETA